MGFEKSAFLVFTSDSSVTVTASLVDDSSPGVYFVEFTIPTTQTLGTYSHTVTMLGEEVFTPIGSIMACSNALAQTKGLVAAPGTSTTTILDYMIEDPMEEITLPLVEYFCAQTPTHILTNAVVSIEDGSNTSLTEAELNAYGIYLLFSDTDPKVQVQSNDSSLATYLTIEIRVTSTVVEETTWAEYAVIILNYSNPSVPEKCTIETQDPTEHKSNFPYALTMQSRSRSGIALTHSGDTYTVTMTRSDGGGD